MILKHIIAKQRKVVCSNSYLSPSSSVSTEKAVHLHQINLANPVERAYYSEQLKKFECEFSYPLNVQTGSYFTIVHGKNEDNSSNADHGDYFSFFEQMGKPSYFVALAQNQSNDNNGDGDNKKNSNIVGAGCAVLIKPENHPPYWYLCDFKISQPWRQKGILLKMLLKYLLPNIIQSHRFMAINMSSRKLDSQETAQSLMAHNGLLRKLKKLFFFLPLNLEMINLYQCTRNNLPIEIEMKNPVIISNHGKKDFILYSNNEDKGQPWDVYHLTDKQNTNIKHYQKKDLNELSDEATILYVRKHNSNNSYDNENLNLNSQAVIISSGISSHIMDNIGTMHI